MMLTEADRNRIERCSGAGTCASPHHFHGCYADLDGSACDEPEAHPEPPKHGTTDGFFRPLIARIKARAFNERHQVTNATDMIAAERERQVADEGYSAEHDAGHAYELTRASQAYAMHAARGLRGMAAGDLDLAPYVWPWAPEYWKPTGDPVRDLTKAAALIAAAIDSLITDTKENK